MLVVSCIRVLLVVLLLVVVLVLMLVLVLVASAVRAEEDPAGGRLVLWDIHSARHQERGGHPGEPFVGKTPTEA